MELVYQRTTSSALGIILNSLTFFVHIQNNLTALQWSEFLLTVYLEFRIWRCTMSSPTRQVFIKQLEGFINIVSDKASCGIKSLIQGDCVG